MLINILQLIFGLYILADYGPPKQKSVRVARASILDMTSHIVGPNGNRRRCLLSFYISQLKQEGSRVSWLLERFQMDTVAMQQRRGVSGEYE